MRLFLSFYIDLESRFQFNGAVGWPDCDLLKPAFYKCFIKYCKVGRLVEKPKWCGDGFMHEQKDTLIPDLITINEYGGQDWFIIFDAKYHLIQLEKGRTLKGNPGVGDVVKQYMYQLAYNKFLEDHHIAVVKNCFLMPTEAKEIINKGKAKLEMLSILGLEDIQIRLIPADMLFNCYLSRQKIPIEKLEL